ncbi:MAG: AhpC/TSA family protein [Marinilabiliales bacterium]|nr:MAG: AhpC/TSA family protein [Marinilabiliales bacterium]
MRTLFSFAITALLIACTGNKAAEGPAWAELSHGSRITGRINGLPGPKLLLYELYGDRVTLIDSVMTGSDGSFEFLFPSGRHNGLYRLAMGVSTIPGDHEGHRQRFDLIWDGSAVVFETHYAAPVDSMTIFLSEENDLYYRYLRRMRRYESKISALNSALIEYPADDGFYRRLERQHRRVQNRRVNYVDNLINKNQGTIVASLARFRKLPRTGSPRDGQQTAELKSNFFHEGQFADSLLLHTDLIPRSIIRYLSLYTNPSLSDDDQQEELILAADVIMQHAMENEAIYYFVLEYLINGFNSMEMDLVAEHLTGRYLLGNVCFEEGRLLDQAGAVTADELEEGDVVPSFSFTALDGREISLEEIEADYTLVLFWGTWCHFCDDVMDELYETYSEYRISNPGYFEVVAIGIEENEDEWLAGIERGGYDWINYTSLEMWDCPVASGYDLVGTPTMLLLDSNKRFITEPVRVRALNRILSRGLR